MAASLRSDDMISGANETRGDETIVIPEINTINIQLRAHGVDTRVCDKVNKAKLDGLKQQKKNKKKKTHMTDV